ncbi:CoA pyrophosphatase [Castellaniella sp. GW247-6E4]|uniref:CoA pyrophosphatase n=1 Tax=Castellaniella sp. GW247-6E4 TaxID=3140380 RepID=UPI0033155FE3
MSDRISSSDTARIAGFDPATQPVLGCEALPGLPAECLRLDYIRDAFQRPVHWQVEPLFTESFSPAVVGPSGARQAAVLMPLVQRDQGLHVVFTRRAEHLHDHAGQISFPGGRIEASDRDPIAAALRETREEIGIDRQFVRVIGVQPSFLTSTHFVMTPIIGELLPGFTIQSDGQEVAEVFEVPLGILMDPAQHRLHELRLPDGAARCYFSITWQSYFIWGATAVLIRNFYHYLAAARLGQ